MVEAAIFVIFPFCMVFAAVSDLLSMTIANRVSLLLVASFAVLAPLTGMDWTTYGWHFLAGGMVLCITFAMFALRAMGGGDAKLMSSTAIWFGFNLTLFDYALTSAFIGGVLTVLILLFRASPFATIHGDNMFLKHLANEKTGVPYGIALGVSGLLVFTQTPLFIFALESMKAQ